MRHQVGVGPNGRLDPGLAQFILEVGRVIERDDGAKRNLLRAVRADGLLDVGAAQGLGRLAFLINQLEREILVVNDLFVLEQLEEARIRDLLKVRVGAPAEKNGEPNEGKGDGDEDHAAPVKARLVSAWWFLFLRIAIRLGHEIESPFLSGVKTLT